MATYIVTYDLMSPGQDYSELHEHLKSYGTYSHRLESTWLLVTTKTATQVRDGVLEHIDSNDKVLVVESGGNGAWSGIPEAGSKWLKEHL